MGAGELFAGIQKDGEEFCDEGGGVATGASGAAWNVALSGGGLSTGGGGGGAAATGVSTTGGCDEPALVFVGFAAGAGSVVDSCGGIDSGDEITEPGGGEGMLDGAILATDDGAMEPGTMSGGP